MTLRSLSRLFTRQQAAGQPPTLPEYPEAYYIDDPLTRTERRRVRHQVERIAIDSHKREVLCMLQDVGHLQISGGCACSLRALAELLAEGLITESHANGRFVISIADRGLVQ